MNKLHILLPLLFLFLTGLSPYARSQSEKQVRRFVDEQSRNYPHLHLLDLYKSCYQDFMGPEHLIPSEEAARNYLQRELDEMDEPKTDRTAYERCGLRGKHIRISLDLVKSGRLPADTLTRWFVQSANTTRKHSLNDWIRYWTKIELVIDKMNLNLPDYEKEKKLIREMFANGTYACSHSAEYRTLYQPHYRIISRKIWKKKC